MTDGAAEGSPPRRALVGRHGLIAYAVALVVVILDQASKFWILNVLDLPNRPPIHILPILQFDMVWNTGVSFGLVRAGSGSGRWLLVIFALAVVIALALWARQVKRTATAAALGLILGGALGNNLIDRVRLGAVADFIDVHGIGFFPWVFNVADIAINVGVALLLLDMFLQPKEQDVPARD